MKEAYWFRHDSNARNDWKILALRSVYGLEGYGRFWYLIEMMRESDDNTLPLNKKAFYYSLVYDWKSSVEDIEKFINDCINEFELFESDNAYFWSNSLNHRLQVYTEQKVKRQEDGRKGGRPRKEQQEQPQEAPEQPESVEVKPIKQKPVRTKNATIAQYDESVIELTDLLLAQIKNNNAQAKTPSNLDSWKNDIRLLLADGYGRDQIEKVIKWCQADEFWKSNILSAKKLREQMGKLILQMGRVTDAKPWTNSKRPIVEVAKFEGYNESDITPERIEEVRGKAREVEELLRMRKVR